MKHILLILASGKSSRFGGYPKAFCKINDTYVAQRTVNLGAPYFDETYLIVNKEVYLKYMGAIKGCKTLAIETGQGDAHSFLRAIRIIKQNCEVDEITLCWGDTFYLDDIIFEKASNMKVNVDTVGVSFSSIDLEPYAWYEVDGEKIQSSHFRSRDGMVKKGIHDQSIFVFNFDMICTQLEKYMAVIGLNDREDYINKEISKEMKLLDSFTYFYENQNSGLLPMKYSLVEKGRCFSFNTQEELELIKKFLKMNCS